MKYFEIGFIIFLILLFLFITYIIIMRTIYYNNYLKREETKGAFEEKGCNFFVKFKRYLKGY
jgi:uncharacterized membrane protein YukC